MNGILPLITSGRREARKCRARARASPLRTKQGMTEVEPAR